MKLKEKSDIALFCTLDSDQFDKNQYYYSGYKGMGCLALPKKKTPFLLVPEMEYERAKQESRVQVIKWKKGKRLFEHLAQVLDQKKIKVSTVGIVESEMSFREVKSIRKYLKARIIDIGQECYDQRKVKSDTEIKIIRKGFKIADEILLACIKKFSTFKTEKQAELFLHAQTIKRGCELSFKPIIASGLHAAQPHYEAREVSIRKGFCVIDFGIIYQGYCTDCTRTVFVGSPTDKQRKAYEDLLAVQNELIRRAKPNYSCKRLFEDCVELLGKKAKYFNHGLGHGVGLQIHELPNLSPASKEKLEENMVFTIEPGVYIPGEYGIRIEDTLLLRKGKIEKLTAVPKILTIIEG